MALPEQPFDHIAFYPSSTCTFGGVEHMTKARYMAISGGRAYVRILEPGDGWVEIEPLPAPKSE